MVPAPMTSGEPPASAAEAERDYRADAARHLYSAYPTRVFRGKLPPLLFSVMMVETEIDAQGQVVDVSIIRKPAVDAVAPWVVAMIKRAAPYPVPPKLVANASGTVRYMDIWLVDKSGLFQVDTLTEGQR
jgi:protein TonB